MRKSIEGLAGAFKELPLGFRGYLHVDGYQGYRKVADITLVGRMHGTSTCSSSCLSL